MRKTTTSIFSPGNWAEVEWTHGPWFVHGLVMSFNLEWMIVSFDAEAFRLDGGLFHDRDGTRVPVTVSLDHLLSPESRIVWIGQQGDGERQCSDCGRDLEFVRGALCCERHGWTGRGC